MPRAATADFSKAYSAAFAQPGDEPIPDQSLLDLLKLFLGIDLDDTSNDPALVRALNLAGLMAERYIDNVIVQRESYEYFAHHVGTVLLRYNPIDLSKPVTVTLSGEEREGYEAFLIAGSAAYLTRTGLAYDMPHDWRNFEQVRVAYTAGWNPLPDDLAQALVYIAADLYNSEGTGSVPGGASGDVKSATLFDVGSMSFDVGSASGGAGGWPTNDLGVINATAASILSSYRRLHV